MAEVTKEQASPLRRHLGISSQSESEDFATQKNLAEDFVKDFDATSDLIMEKRSHNNIPQPQVLRNIAQADHLPHKADFPGRMPMLDKLAPQCNSAATSLSTFYPSNSQCSTKDDTISKRNQVAVSPSRSPFVGAWTDSHSIWGAPKTDNNQQVRPLTPNPTNNSLLGKKSSVGLQVNTFFSDSLNKAPPLAPSAFSKPNAKYALEDLIDLNTVALLSLNKLKPKQRQILLRFNRRCLFCHKVAHTKIIDANFYFVSDKKNCKYFLAHKDCGQNIAAKYGCLDSYLLQSSKLTAFSQVMNEGAFAQPLGTDSLEAAFHLKHPLHSQKPFYRMKRYPLLALSQNVSQAHLQPQERVFISKSAASLRVVSSFVKLRIEFKIPGISALEAGIDLFALAHEVDIGQRVQCEAEVPGGSITLEFTLHELMQPEGLNSDAAGSSSDEDNYSKDCLGGRVEYLLQNMRTMVKFVQCPLPQKLQQQQPASPQKPLKEKKKLKLQDIDSESSDSDIPTLKISAPISRLCNKEESEEEDVCPLKKTPGLMGLSGLKKFNTESQVSKVLLPPQSTLKLKRTDSDGTSSENSNKAEPLQIPALSGLKALSNLPKYTSWAGVQHLNDSSHIPEGPPVQQTSLFQKQLQSQHQPMQQTPYYLSSQGGAPFPYQVNPYASGYNNVQPQFNGVMAPPPGLAKFTPSHGGFVETSQGMSFVPYTAPPFTPMMMDYEGFGEDDMIHKMKKKVMAPLKKKGTEKSKLVSYYGELLTLTMGVDAKDTQVTEFEMQLFASGDNVENVEGKIVELAKSYSGSRALQGYLSKGSPQIVRKIIQESTIGICQLMTDKYGNYYCQKLLQSCSAQQRLNLLRNMVKDFYKISSDWSGTHSMQRLVELLSMEDELALVQQGIEGQVLDFAVQGQATHVLQKVIVQFPQAKIDYIFNPVCSNLLELCNDQNGLCVVKKLISCTKSESKICHLSDGLAEITRECVQDPFGNYAIQHAIEVWANSKKYRAEIVGILLRHAVQFSSTKYSSNVIEKCIELVPKDFSIPFAHQLIQTPDTLLQLLNNLFGTFVIQKLIECLPPVEVRARMLSAVQTHLKGMNDKSLKGKWESFLKREGITPLRVKISKQSYREDYSSPSPTLQYNHSPLMKPLQVKLNLAAQSFSGGKKA